MRKGIQTSMSAEIKEMERATWHCDSERSHAHFAWHRVRHGDKTYFRFDEELELSPYPNPFSFGGMWGSGGADTEEKLQEHIEKFKKEAERWRKHGLLDIKIVEEEEQEIPAVPHVARISEAGRPGRYRIDRQRKLEL